MLKGDLPGHPFRGNQYTTGIEGVNEFNKAPIDKASASKKWRSQMQERYTNDHDFKILADTLALYTQGDYSSIRVFSQYVVTNNIPPELADSMYPKWIEDNFAMNAL